jgi:oxygen-independent coproporphyrinogen-3 oxidase
MKLPRLAAGLLSTLLAAVSSALSVVRPPPTFAYVHIPFCRRRCFYCDFPIHVVGDQGPTGGAAEAYVTLLKREIAATAATRLGNPDGDVGATVATGGQRLGEAVAAAGGLETVYVGGGTPSLLAPSLLADLMATLKMHYGGLAPVSSGNWM